MQGTCGLHRSFQITGVPLKGRLGRLNRLLQRCFAVTVLATTQCRCRRRLRQTRLPYLSRPTPWAHGSGMGIPMVLGLRVPMKESWRPFSTMGSYLESGARSPAIRRGRNQSEAFRLLCAAVGTIKQFTGTKLQMDAGSNVALANGK